MQWEYRYEKTDGVPMSNVELNGLGADGWELVGFTSSATGANFSFHHIFRRPRKKS